MTNDEKLHAALLKFFNSLALFKIPGLNEKGMLVDASKDSANITEFSTLKNALDVVRQSSPEFKDLTLDTLLTFFKTMTNCGAFLTPMYAPVYIKSIDDRWNVKLYDMKTIFQTMIQNPNSTLARAVRTQNILPVIDLFIAMKKFSVDIKDISADYLAEKLDDLDRIKNLHVLPPLDMQQLFWTQYLLSFNTHQQTSQNPGVSDIFFIGVLLLFINYVFDLFPINHQQAIFILLIAVLLVSMLKMSNDLWKSWRGAPAISDDKVELTEDNILQIGKLISEFFEQSKLAMNFNVSQSRTSPVCADIATKRLSIQSQGRALFQKANIDPASLNEHMQKLFGYDLKKYN